MVISFDLERSTCLMIHKVTEHPGIVVETLCVLS